MSEDAILKTRETNAGIKEKYEPDKATRTCKQNTTKQRNDLNQMFTVHVSVYRSTSSAGPVAAEVGARGANFLSLLQPLRSRGCVTALRYFDSASSLGIPAICIGKDLERLPVSLDQRLAEARRENHALSPRRDSYTT